MSDYSKLNNVLEKLAAKVDDLLAKANAPAPAPVDEQPAIDAVAEKADAILAKIDPPHGKPEGKPVAVDAEVVLPAV